MNHYEIWFNLQDSSQDVAFAGALGAFLDRLRGDGVIASWRLKRRKLGFGPPELGEFNVTIACETLDDLDRAFSAITPRSGDMEMRHARVWGMVKDFRSGLWRDFPDENR